MPQPPHRRLSFEGVFGTLLAPVEEWSFRFNLDLGESGGNDQALVDAAAAAFTTHLVARIKPVARLKQVKLASIGADGKYTADPVVKEMDTPGTGSATVNLPLSTALAISLSTQRRGPTGRGRFFLPAPNLGALDSNGLIASNDQTLFGNSAAAFLTALNGPAGFGNVAIVSSKGYSTPVIGVRVGRVPDVIRSRREKLTEAYATTVAVALS